MPEDDGLQRFRVHLLGQANAPFSSSDDHRGDPGRVRAPLNKYALSGVILASTNSVLLGYDIGVMSGAVLFIRESLQISPVQVEVLVGSLNVVSLIGSLAAGWTSDRIGRRHTVTLAALTFFVGSILMGLAPSFPFLMVGRVVAGVGVGYALTIAPVYAAELSPATTRGFLSSLPEVFINVGILLGYVSNYMLAGLPGDVNWRVMLGLAAFPSLAIAVGVMAMPESPRWLVMQGRTAEAKGVLARTLDGDLAGAESRLNEIIKAADLADSSLDLAEQRRGVWEELLWRQSPPVRRILIAAIGVNFLMQASGNDAVVYYSPEVLRDAGINSNKQLVGVTIIMGISKAVFAFISAIFLDRFGRRPLLLLGSAGMAVSLAGLGVGSKFLRSSGSNPPWAISLFIATLCADVSFFSIGLGPIAWVYSSEIFPTRLRAQGTSLAIAVNRMVSGVVAMSFLSATRAMTFGGTFFVLAGIMCVGSAFIYFFLPETKGKNLEEIWDLFDPDC